ncbi:hypothetical protein ES705_46503 [subsurface metagenome]
MAAERIRRIPVIDSGELVGVVADVTVISISPEMNSIMAELIEINGRGETFGIECEDDGMGQGICEKCGSFSYFMEIHGGLMVCESCKEEIEMEMEAE